MLAVIGAGTTLVQVVYQVINDSIICLNQGCSVVESLLRIPPIWFNGVGTFFFISLLLCAIASRFRPGAEGVLRLLLLLGVAAEGVLFSYQAFVAQTFCSYCLFICFLIIIMNILAGWRQACLAVLLFTTELIIFSLLQFHDPEAGTESLNLNHGTYAVKRSISSQKQLYLLFSTSCPQCQMVLDLLRTSTQCEVRFNPVKHLDTMVLPDLDPMDSWDPNINASTLKILGIDTIPVLVEKSGNGMRFIRGGRDIMAYLKENCVEPLPVVRKSMNSFLPFDLANEDECRIDVDCSEQTEPPAYLP
ncbi:vitamin K epoxide reductase family protein [Desulfotalea psychrophila]|nr:vitamin K epoxide reductase family protein [Desulfotalea psychrophila]